jgi:hypothetical protein
LDGREVAKDALRDLGISAIGFGERLEASLTERVEAGAYSCKQRA